MQRLPSPGNNKARITEGLYCEISDRGFLRHWHVLSIYFSNQIHVDAQQAFLMHTSLFLILITAYIKPLKFI